jgi:hypothetical protein
MLRRVLPDTASSDECRRSKHTVAAMVHLLRVYRTTSERQRHNAIMSRIAAAAMDELPHEASKFCALDLPSNITSGDYAEQNHHNASDC